MITDRIKKILNRSTPDNQLARLGDLIQNIEAKQAKQPQVIEFPVTADATGGLSITVPYAMRVFDVIVECRAANALGTLTLRSGSNAITDAIVCAVDKVKITAGTIDDAYSSITTATDLNVISNGAGDRGMVTILGYPA